MPTLIPRDHWQHSVGDLLRCLVAALASRRANASLQIPAIGGCIPVRSGRAAIVTAIRALNLPPGARVGVPLFCCPIVFKAVTATGCAVRFIDIDASTFCVSPDDLSTKHSELDAIVAVHMFGNVCDIPRLQEAARGKPIIEDCAQSLGSKDDSCPTGSSSAIAIFSFRSGKYLSVGEGGALFSRHAGLCSRISELVAAMPLPSRPEECTHMAACYTKALLRSRPLYGMVGYTLWNTLNKKVNLSANSGVSLSQIYKTDLAIASRRLGFLDLAIERQRANADIYSRTLSLDPLMLCSEKRGAHYNRYLYPITFESSEQRNRMATYLLRHKIDTMQYLDDVVDVATKQYGYNGGCPTSERLSKRVLVVPNYHSLKKREIHRIAQCINEGWMETESHG